MAKRPLQNSFASPKDAAFDTNKPVHAPSADTVRSSTANQRRGNDFRRIAAWE
jgi:hypothetical protein